MKKTLTALFLAIVLFVSSLPFNAMAFTVLKEGSKGDDVKKVQTVLRLLDYPVTADGSYGKGTAKYVKEFQKDHGLSADGKVGKGTWNAMKRYMPDSSGWIKEFFPLKKGMKGSSVKKMQSVLKAHGYKVTADGHFGSGTKTALIRYQKAHHLTADGVVGAATWKSIKMTRSASIDPQRLNLPIKKGMSGADVMLIQKALRSHGFNAGSDGKYDSGVVSAVKKYQKMHGLTANGVVAAKTWNVMISNISLGTPVYDKAKVTYSKSRFPVQEGSSKADIKLVQKALVDKGYTAVAVNGSYDAATKAAVADFQSKNKISATGIVKMGTWEALVATDQDKENIELLAKIIRRESNSGKAGQLAVAQVVICYADLAGRSIEKELKSGRYSPANNWKKFLKTEPTEKNYKYAKQAYYGTVNPFGDKKPYYFKSDNTYPKRGSWWTKMELLGMLYGNVYYSR